MDTFGNDLGTGGQVLSREELIKKRQRNGMCPTCGQKCFKKKLFKLEPITVTGKVLNGRCLSCNPQDPKKEELVASCAVVRPPPRSGRSKGKPRSAMAASMPAANLQAGGKKALKSSRALLKGSRMASTGDIAHDSDEEDQPKPPSSRSAPVGRSKGENGAKLDRRDSMERRGSSHRDNFMQRPTPRPSQIILGGIDIDELFKEGDEAEADIGNTGRSGDTNGTASTALSQLSSEERRALQSLNSDKNSFMEVVNIMMCNSTSAAVQNEGLHALSLVHDSDVGLLEECAMGCGFEVIVSAMGKCSKVRV